MNKFRPRVEHILYNRWFFKGFGFRSLNTFYPMALCIGKVQARLGIGNRKYAPYKWFWMDWSTDRQIVTKGHSQSKYHFHIRYVHWHFIVHIVLLSIKVCFCFFTSFSSYMCPFFCLCVAEYTVLVPCFPCTCWDLWCSILWITCHSISWPTFFPWKMYEI